MLRRPRFKSHFRVEIVEPDLLFLLTETDSHLVRSRLHVLLAPLLNGQRNFAAIARRLANQITPLDIRYGLESLEKRGYLTEANGRAPLPSEVLCEALEIPISKCGKRLRTQGVSITALTDVPRNRFAGILESLGISVRKKGGFLVVLTDDYLREELQEVNRRALRHKRPWMIVKPVGTQLWIGPIFQPGRTGCWECLAKRLREHRQAEVFLKRFQTGTGPAGRAVRASLASTVETALSLAATEAWKWIVQGKNEALTGKLVTLSVKSLAWKTHHLVRQARCPACGEVAKNCEDRSRGLVLKAREREFSGDGGYRSEPPEETYRKHRHQISAITGIVGNLQRRRAEDDGLIHVFIADHSFPLVRPSVRWLAGGFRSRGAGKGMTAAQARTSALCEALERYSGAFQGNEPRTRAYLRDLGAAAIHPHACLNFSLRQYRDREEWNRRESRYNWVPMPFDQEREIDWTAAWSLTNSCRKYVPTAYCYYGYPLGAEHDFCRSDSNGNAAGSTMEEAILQGILELVERDAVALWWYNRAKRPAVDLDSFEQPYFHRLKKYYNTIGRSMYVLDITSDFGIPTFAAVSPQQGIRGPSLLLGFGAHLNAELAIGRALTEMNQFLPQIRLGKRRMAFENDLEETSFLIPEPSLGTPSARDYRGIGGEDLLEDVKICVKLADQRGMETLVVDQTRADVELCVVKVIIPGMRQFWARFAPGRLYAVPVQLGWLETPRQEAELNKAHLSI
jgi:oxazoline/thiazoline synthase